ncbi:MAG: hypothetical protein IPM83_11995 [Ignavibacteria bacterium]|nr:hypothetical protein [Ignavibacteria bacterium]
MWERLILILILCTLASDLHAQRQAENWYFGEFAGLNFASGNPTVLLDGAMQTREGCLTVSDTIGRLMFYSDGTRVWTRTHQTMPNGSALSGDPSSTQSGIVIPWPTRPSQYFIFTVDALENLYARGLNYSVVNMASNGGLGDVTTRNQSLQSGTAEKLTAVRHANGVDVWLIAHDIGNNQFLVYLITRNGVNPVPLRQAVGPAVMTGDIGYLKATSIGTRLAMATTVPPQLNMFRFDRSTGVISAPTRISNQLAYGVEFSPNGQLLYSTSYTDAAIYQYDLSLPDANVATSRMSIGRTGAITNGALQIAPNGKIYVAHEFSDIISEIAQPNIRGNGCQYRDRVIDLGGRQSRLGLPNMFPAVFSNETQYEIVTSNGCVGDTIDFVLEPKDSVLNLRWTFDDPSSGSNDRASGNPVSHVYRTAGSYEVRVTYRTRSGFDQERFITVVIGTRPLISAGADQSVCKGATVVLQALGAAQFSWSPGALLNDSTIARPRATVTETTTFILTGRGPEGCESYDTVVVNVLVGSVSVSPDTTICEGSIAQLRASGAQTYEWSPANGLSDVRSAEPLARPDTTTRYRVIGRTASCVDTAYVTVTVADPLEIIVSKDVTVCAGVETTLYASGGVAYRWTPAAEITDPTASSVVVRPMTTTTYTVHVTSAAGCVDSSKITVTVADSVTVVLSNDTTICTGVSIQLTCSNTGVVTWTDRSTGATTVGTTLTVQPITTTWYVVDVVVGGCTGRDSIRVNVTAGPPLDISSDTTICIGDTATIGVTGSVNVTWSPATNIEYTDRPTTRVWPSVTTTYTATANNAGCVSTASVVVNVQQRLAITLQSETVVATPGETATIPIIATSDLTGVTSLLFTARAPRSLATINVVPQAGLSERTRTNVGDDQIVEYEINTINSPPELCTLSLSVFLSASTDRVVTCSASPLGCASDGSMNIVLDLGQCAGVMRTVQIGQQAPLTVEISPHPFDEQCTVSWSSASVGLHSIEIYTSEGTLVSSEFWTRTVQSPTSGQVHLRTNELAQGVYVVQLRTANGIRSFVGMSRRH